jgi:hypothetical protein
LSMSLLHTILPRLDISRAIGKRTRAGFQAVELWPALARGVELSGLLKESGYVRWCWAGIIEGTEPERLPLTIVPYSKN